MNDTIEIAIRQILTALGENPHRAGLLETPSRVARSLKELTSGYNQSPLEVASDALFPCVSSGMVMQKNIEFYSLCEHHMLPFFGRVHVAYMPSRKIIGLSKVGRIIDIFAKRLQVQEQLNHDIAQALHQLLDPRGVAVSIEANHFCMMMRGVKKQSGLTLTSEFTGVFESNLELRKEFLTAIKN